MYRRPSKKRELATRFFVYGAMTIAVVTTVTILILVILGYQFNKKDGTIEQGGLLQLISTPADATVTVDGVMLGSRTSTKLTTTASTHFVQMSKANYRGWEKSITLSAGGVGWLNYARLIPNDTTPSSVATYPQVTGTLATPDRKWYAIKTAPDTPDITVANIQGDTVGYTTLAIPTNVFTAPPEGQTQQFTLSEWDESSRYLLVSHTYGDQSEWLVIDRDNPRDSINLTSRYGKPLGSLQFADTSGYRFYGLDGSDLRLFELDSTPTSKLIRSSVAEYSFYRDIDTLSYTSTPDEAKKQSVGYVTTNSTTPVTIKTFTDVSSLHIALGNYYDERYIAISHNDTTEIIKGALPLKDNDTSGQKMIATATLPSIVEYLSIRTEGRFIIMQHGDVYDTYDIELGVLHTTTLKGESPVTTKLSWLDNYITWNDRDGTLRFYDFDGGNRQDISSVAPGYAVSLSPNGRYVYSIGKTVDGSFQLQRSRLILN